MWRINKGYLRTLPTALYFWLATFDFLRFNAHNPVKREQNGV